MNVMYALCMLTKLTGRIELEVNQHRSMSKYSANLQQGVDITGDRPKAADG
jgi:hypothetical protein